VRDVPTGRRSPAGSASTAADLEAARRLFGVDGVFTIVAAMEQHGLRGFGDFLEWFRRRREAVGASFGYRVDELPAGERQRSCADHAQARRRRARGRVAAGGGLPRRAA